MKIIPFYLYSHHSNNNPNYHRCRAFLLLFFLALLLELGVLSLLTDVLASCLLNRPSPIPCSFSLGVPGLLESRAARIFSLDCFCEPLLTEGVLGVELYLEVEVFWLTVLLSRVGVPLCVWCLPAFFCGVDRWPSVELCATVVWLFVPCDRELWLRWLLVGPIWLSEESSFVWDSVSLLRSTGKKDYFIVMFTQHSQKPFEGETPIKN